MLNYCSKCFRTFKTNEDTCPYCHSTESKEAKKLSPFNIIGTKTKGKLFKILDDTAILIVISENQEKLLKEYPIKDLKKLI